MGKKEKKLSIGELRERSQKLEEVQQNYEELAYLANPKMPCPECSGGGVVDSGSLGSGFSPQQIHQLGEGED